MTLTRPIAQLLSLLTLLSLTACATTPTTPETNTPPLQPEPPAATSQCAASLELPQNLRPIADDPLHLKAIGASGQGGACQATTVEVTAELRIWRVWRSSSPHARLGQWWSLEPPDASYDAYQQRFAICPSWGALDRLVSCQLSPGDRLIIGDIQSMRCDQDLSPNSEQPLLYPASSTLQLFIDKDDPSRPLSDERCQDEPLPWPSP